MFTGINEKLDIDFEHWSCELTAKELRKWGSPHFNPREVGEAVRNIFRHHGERQSFGQLTFSRQAIALANHAYPEAALVDPVADLELWEEWRQGLREFPYLGRYAPLGIFHQAGKTSSPSSVGVLGEVLAGRFAESMIAPTVLVRVIRRWPDFILLERVGDGNGQFAFLESKAAGPDVVCRADVCGGGRVPDAPLLELGYHVIQQLNADPYIEVWGAFTYVHAISPMKIAFTLIQFAAAQDKKVETNRSGVPAPVLSGLAERSLGAALAKMSDGERADFLAVKRQSSWRKERENRLVAMAFQEFGSILRDEMRQSVPVADEDIAWYLERALERLPRDAQLPGRRTREARGVGDANNALVPIGSVGGQQIFMANLPESDEKQLPLFWKADWMAASQPREVHNGVELWRCGGALFAIGEPDLLGTVVLPKYAMAEDDVRGNG